MKTQRLKISQTQNIALRLLDDPQVVTLLFGGGAGGAKALRHGTKVATPFGFRKIEDLEIGQTVIGGDGKPTRIIAKTYRGVRPIYRVVFSDGASIDVDGDHLWAYCFARKGKWEKSKKPWKVATTIQLEAAMVRGRRILIPLTGEVGFTKSYKVDMRPIDPYVLGVLLGDGHLRRDTVSFTTIDQELMRRVIDLTGGKWSNCRISYNALGDVRINLLKGLKKLGLEAAKSANKFIPESYKYASVKNRWELLKGLMDTDGTCNSEGRISYCSISYQLAKDMQFLVRSLGGKATITQHEPVCTFADGSKKVCATAYKVYIKLQDNKQAFHLTRKKEKAHTSSIVVKRRITSIESVGQDEATCITVDNPDGLFIATEDFIVTHNSVIVCLWMIIQCAKYPGIRIGLGRKELKRLKETTVVTLLQKAHHYLEVEDNEFKYNDQKGIITYIDGSAIQLIDMARQPSDPEYDTFGSLEFTHVVIEEVGEVPEKAVDVLTSRKDRFMNKEYGIVGKTVMTCNPTQNFIRKRFYEVYKSLGAGKYQVWDDGQVELPSTKEMVTAKAAFVRSLATDNPFISRNYIEELKKKPSSTRKRLLYGDWDYADDKDLLTPITLINRAMTGMMPNIDNPPKGVGADIADKGDDKTILSYVENFVLMHQEEVIIDTSPEAKPIGEQIALAIIRFAQQRGVTAKNVAFDSVGVGASTRDQLKGRGWQCIEFDAGAAVTEPGYYNYGSQVKWKMREDMDADKFKIYRELPTLEDLRTEMLAHPYDEDPVIRVRKDRAKQELGHSPDYFDSAVMAYDACKININSNYGLAW